MRLPTVFSRFLVVLVTAVLVPALLLGGQWLAEHPVPGEVMQPVLMLAGLGAVVYGARKAGR